MRILSMKLVCLPAEHSIIFNAVSHASSLSFGDSEFCYDMIILVNCFPEQMPFHLVHPL